MSNRQLDVHRPHSLWKFDFLGPITASKTSLRKIREVSDEGVLPNMYHEHIPSPKELADIGLTGETADQYPWGVIGRHGIFRYGQFGDGRVAVIMTEKHDESLPQMKKNWLQSIYPGFYLQDKNLNEVFGVSARKKRTRHPWVRDEIYAFEKAYSHYQQRAGLICRVSSHEWRSDHVVYTLTRCGQKDGQKLYKLDLYTSAGLDADPVEQNIDSSWVRKFNIRPKAPVLTMREAEEAIPYDFYHRTKSILRGYDALSIPYVLMKDDPLPPFEMKKKNLLSWVKTKAHRLSDELLHKLPEQRGSFLFWGLQAASITLATVLKAFTKTSKLVLISDFASGMADKIKKYSEAKGAAIYDHSGEEYIETLLRPGQKSIRMGPFVTFGKADQEQLQYFQLLSQRDAGIKMQGYNKDALTAEESAEARKQWALSYILSTDKAPYGTERLYFEVNGHNIIIDNQSNGLRVFYIIDKDRCAYAEYDPDLVQNGEADLDEDIKKMVEGKFVCVYEDKGFLKEDYFPSRDAMIASMVEDIKHEAEHHIFSEPPPMPNSIPFKEGQGYDAERAVIGATVVMSQRRRDSILSAWDKGDQSDVVVEQVSDAAKKMITLPLGLKL